MEFGDCCLSQAASEYAKAILSPWASQPIGAPQGGISIPTVKWKSQMCFTFSVGTTGFAAVAWNPWAASASDQAAANSTTSAYANNFINIGGAGTTDHFSTSLYTGSDLDSVRVVASSLRISYTGKALDRSGVVYLLEDPFHLSLQAANVTNAMAKGAVCVPVTDAQRVLLWTGPKGNRENEIAYWNPGGSGFQDVLTSPIAAIITGAVPGTTFMAMIDTLHEGILKSNNVTATVNPSDPQGSSIVVTSVRDGQKKGDGLFPTIAHAAGDVMGKLLQAVAPAVGKAVSAKAIQAATDFIVTDITNTAGPMVLRTAPYLIA